MDQDRNFLDRLVQACTSKYSDKLEVHAFTDATLAETALKQQGIDVFLANQSYEVIKSAIPARCVFAYLSETASVESVHSYKAVYKYQKIEVFYKNILELYSENIPEGIGINFGGDSALKIVSFSSASGGVGVSTVAATYAKLCASWGMRVLYLNLERFASTSVFFSGAGTATFSDIIYALKSRRGNLMMKLESNVRRDASGVCFFAACPTALDMQEFAPADIDTLLMDIQLSGSYDLLVIDLDTIISAISVSILLKSTAAVFVSDGSETANLKLKQAVGSLEILERQKDTSILARTAVLYNKFSNRTSLKLENINTRTIGGFPRYEHATTTDVIGQLLSNPAFSQI
jgi:cellulose biosynthesis protein BcsQ